MAAMLLFSNAISEQYRETSEALNDVKWFGSGSGTGRFLRTGHAALCASRRF